MALNLNHPQYNREITPIIINHNLSTIYIYHIPKVSLPFTANDVSIPMNQSTSQSVPWVRAPLVQHLWHSGPPMHQGAARMNTGMYLNGGCSIPHFWLDPEIMIDLLVRAAPQPQFVGSVCFYGR